MLTKNSTANKKEIRGNTWTVILAILWQTEGRSWVTRTESLGERFCGTEIKTSEVGVMPFGASTPEVRGAQTWESVAQGRCFKAGYGSRKNNKQQQTTTKPGSRTSTSLPGQRTTAEFILAGLGPHKERAWPLLPFAQISRILSRCTLPHTLPHWQNELRGQSLNPNITKQKWEA